MNNISSEKKKSKKPLLIALSISFAAIIGSVTTFVVSKNLGRDPDIPVPPPIPPKPEPGEIEKMFIKFYEAKEAGKDITKEFTSYELHRMYTYKFLFGLEKSSNDENKYLTVGFGSTITSVLGLFDVNVTISNSLIKIGDKSYEESISFADNFIAKALAQSKRDYDNSDKIISWSGQAESDQYHAKYNSSVDFAREDYINTVGKLPEDPFMYDIVPETILNTSKSENLKSGGFKITFDLNPKLSTLRYSKRMKHISGKCPDEFSNVNIVFITDSELNLLESEVNEDYTMTSFPTHGNLKTKYIRNDVPNIPEINESFDYSKYKF